MNWFALVTMIINILVLIFFILIAIVLCQIRKDKERYPNITTISSGNLTALYIGAIIFAVIAGIQVLTSIGALVKPEYFGQEKCKKSITKHMSHTGMPQAYLYQSVPSADVVAQPMYGQAPIVLQ